MRIAADLARNEPAAVAQMYRAAQRMNLNTVGNHAEREEFLGLVRDLEGAGCVEVRETELATSYGVFSVTEEGHRQLAAPKPLPEASETAEEETQSAKQQRRRRASGGPQEEGGTEQAQSTREEELRRTLEDLAEERRRREEAERERDELRRELEQLPRPARPWWVLGLLLIVVVVTLVALSLGAILSPP